MTQAVPENGRRARLLTWLMSKVVGYGSRYGEVYTTSALEGVAVWLTPGNTTLTFGRMLRAGMIAAPLRFSLAELGRLGALFTYTETLHRHHAPEPHWYLFSLGVEPAQQGKGIGGALIRPALARADVDGLPCYLETQSERNAPFYEKHGFNVVSEGEAPQGGLRVWAMLREAER